MSLTITRSGGSYFHTYSDGSKKIHQGAKVPIMMNSNFPSYTWGGFPFINLLKFGKHTGNSGSDPLDSNGYPSGTTTGIISLIIASNYWPGGNVVVKWVGTAKCSLSGASASLIDDEVTEAGRRVYSTTQQDSGNVQVNIASGGTCTDLAAYFESEEDNYDAGDLLNTAFKSDWENMDVWRCMNWIHANGSYVKDYSDISPYTAIVWGFTHDRHVFPLGVSIPFRAMAEAVVEMDTDLWITIPHKATDACVTAIAQELNTHLTAGWKSAHILWVEYCNENWNGASSFNDSRAWMVYGDVASVDATCDPAINEVTSSTHGLSTGDDLAFFSTREHNIWPWAHGGERRIYVVDANTFQTGVNFTAATKANPCQLTVPSHQLQTGDTVTIYTDLGMTELNTQTPTVTRVDSNTITLDGVDSTGYSTYNSSGTNIVVYDELPNTRITTLTYKDIGASTPDRAGHFAARSVEVWDLIEAELTGVTMYRVGGGKAAVANEVTLQMADTNWTAAIDYVALAPYFGPYGINPLSDYENKTIQEAHAWITGESYQTTPEGWWNDHVAELGHTRIIMYEGGAGADPATSGDTAAKNAKHLEWLRDEIIIDGYEWNFQKSADLGYKIYAVYKSYEYADNGQYYGQNEYSGEQDFKWQAVNARALAGGCVKS